MNSTHFSLIKYNRQQAQQLQTMALQQKPLAGKAQ
jgi:hypothetical protein